MRPILFSTYFDIDPSAFDSAGLLDPYINTDTPLFIDPLLIDKSSNMLLASEGLDQFRKHYETLVRLLTIAEEEGDPAWLALNGNSVYKNPQKTDWATVEAQEQAPPGLEMFVSSY